LASEPKGSSPTLKSQPPVPILSQLNPLHTPPQPISPKIHSDPIYASVFQIVSFPRALPAKPCTISLPSHAREIEYHTGQVIKKSRDGNAADGYQNVENDMNRLSSLQH
jgi:hypothetical protein